MGRVRDGREETFDAGEEIEPGEFREEDGVEEVGCVVVGYGGWCTGFLVDDSIEVCIARVNNAFVIDGKRKEKKRKEKKRETIRMVF